MAHPDLTWFCAECGYKRTEGQPHVCKTSEERLAELQEAARAFVDSFIAQAARCVLCEEEGKSEPIMLREGLRMACDAHGRELLIAPRELSYAPALRELRRLLAEGPR